MDVSDLMGHNTALSMHTHPCRPCACRTHRKHAPCSMTALPYGDSSGAGAAAGAATGAGLAALAGGVSRAGEAAARTDTAVPVRKRERMGHRAAAGSVGARSWRWRRPVLARGAIVLQRAGRAPGHAWLPFEAPKGHVQGRKTYQQ